MRWIGLVCALAAVAALAGYQVGERTVPEPRAYDDASPIPAVSPSLPVDTAEPYAPDIDYPTLEPDLSYKPHVIGPPTYRWTYDVPRGWVIDPVAFQEVRWRPDDEPELGGFSMRVKIINAHLTPQQMVAQKITALRALYEDVRVIARTPDTLSFRYRESSNRLRFNTFQWFTQDGGTTADFEMSVVGREQDVVGLEDLLDHVAASVRRVPPD